MVSTICIFSVLCQWYSNISRWNTSLLLLFPSSNHHPPVKCNNFQYSVLTTIKNAFYSSSVIISCIANVSRKFWVTVEQEYTWGQAAKSNKTVKLIVNGCCEKQNRFFLKDVKQMEGGLSVSIRHDGIDLFLHCVKFLKYYLLPCNNRVRFLYTILFFF